MRPHSQIGSRSIIAWLNCAAIHIKVMFTLETIVCLGSKSRSRGTNVFKYKSLDFVEKKKLSQNIKSKFNAKRKFYAVS